MLRDYYYFFLFNITGEITKSKNREKNTIIVRLTDTTNSSLFDFRDMKTPPFVYTYTSFYELLLKLCGIHNKWVFISDKCAVLYCKVKIINFFSLFIQFHVSYNLWNKFFVYIQCQYILCIYKYTSQYSIYYLCEFIKFVISFNLVKIKIYNYLIKF